MEGGRKDRAIVIEEKKKNISENNPRMINCTSNKASKQQIQITVIG